MKLFRSIIASATAISLAVLMSSCHHKDLEFATPVARIQVVFDWSKASDATAESMMLYMYDVADNSLTRYMFDNRYGGEIHAPFGTFSAVCLNGDNTDCMFVRNTEDIEGFELYTAEVSTLSEQSIDARSVPRAAGTESERIVATPQMAWGSRADNITLQYHEGTTTVTMYPEESVCHYTVTVEDVDGLDNARGATIDATLSGMAEAFRQGQMQANDNSVTMPFALAASTTDNSLKASFLTFGECNTRSLSHILTVYVILDDGSKWYYTYDVTSQITNAPDPRHVDIVVRGLSLPKPISGGNGFIPQVNDWQSINVNLDMTV